MSTVPPLATASAPAPLSLKSPDWLSALNEPPGIIVRRVVRSEEEFHVLFATRTYSDVQAPPMRMSPEMNNGVYCPVENPLHSEPMREMDPCLRAASHSPMPQYDEKVLLAANGNLPRFTIVGPQPVPAVTPQGA